MSKLNRRRLMPSFVLVRVSLPRPNPIWNATSFRGSILPLSQFIDAADQREQALKFFRNSRDVLAGRS